MLITLIAVLFVASLMAYTIWKNRHVMFTLPAASVGVFILWYLALYAGEAPLFFNTFAFRTSEPLSPGLVLAMFFHVEPYHIFGNMLVLLLTLLVYSRLREGRLAIAIYLTTGIMAHITYFAVNLGTDIALIGASGAIFGLLGALLALHPNERMPAFIGPVLVMDMRVVYAVPIMAALEVFFMFLAPYDHVARVAHIGGLLFGYILAKPLAGTTSRAEEFSEERRMEIMRTLATTPELREILKRVEMEDDPIMRYFWAKEFFQKKFGDVKEGEDGFVAGGGKYRFRKPM